MPFTLNESDLVGRVSIDLINDIIYCFDKVPEGSGSGRYILINVNKNGVPFNFSSLLTVVIGGQNASGTNVYNNCIIYEENGINKVLVPLNSQISAAPGVGKYRIEFIDTATKTAVESFNFNILVSPAPYNIGSIIKSQEYQALINALSDSNSWIVGQGVPSDGIGKMNDYYLDVDLGDIYKKEAQGNNTVWVSTTYNIKEYVYVRYAPTDNVTLSDMTTTTDNNTRFIGFCSRAGKVAPTNKADYSPWQRFRNEIKSQTFKYQTSTDGTTPPTGSWSSTIPSTIKGGDFLWTKITHTFEDNSVRTFYTVARDGISIQQINVSYQVGNSGTTIPSGTWSTTVPVVGANQYLWTRHEYIKDDAANTTTFSYSVIKQPNGVKSMRQTATSTADGGTNTFTFTMDDNTTEDFSVLNGSTGKAAGFGTPTYDNTDADNIGTAKCEVTASGPDTAKIFNFKFSNLKGTRGSQWFSGTAISSAGTSTAFTSANVYINDMYTNTSNGDIFQCTATTSTNSTWVAAGSISSGVGGDMEKRVYANNSFTGVVDKAIELNGVTFLEQTLTAGNTSVTFTNDVFVGASSSGNDKYMYRIFTSNPNVRPLSITVSNGQAVLTFGKQSSALNVAIEIRKR